MIQIIVPLWIGLGFYRGTTKRYDTKYGYNKSHFPINILASGILGAAFYAFPLTAGIALYHELDNTGLK